jgi:glycine amidinotransferase/scyllo-inosamine-4-phosphate amidinotransferase 1
MLNASRVKNDDQIPKFLRDKKKIYINDAIVKERSFFRFPYASKWIGLNILSLNPETLFVDTIQDNLSLILKKEGFEVINTPLTHSRTLGGGFHCITCDLERLD